MEFVHDLHMKYRLFLHINSWFGILYSRTTFISPQEENNTSSNNAGVYGNPFVTSKKENPTISKQ